MMNPVDEYFKKDLESIEIKPSADLWKNKIQPQIEEKKVKPVFWYRAAAVIILLMSSWFVVDNFQPKANQVHTIQYKEPVIVDVEEPKAHDVTAPIQEPIQDALVVEMNKPAKTTKQTKVAVQESAVTNAEQAIVLADVTEPEVLPETITEVPQKKKIKVKLSLSNTATAMAATEEPKVQEEENVGDYAREQWNNIKHGEKIEAPEKSWIALPKVKFEGNPLKGMFASKTE